MLLELSIQNYALIRSCEVSFEDGLSVLTGETGSGKSIIIGALGTVLGERADTNVLLDKERKCIIEASFDIRGYGLESFFESAELDHEDQSILRREIHPKGRSRAFINDTPVRLETLKAFGERLVDIHGQDETRLLKDKAFITRFLDAFSGQEDALDAYQKLFREHKELCREWEEVKERIRSDRADEDYYRFQLNELDEFELDPEEFEREEEELKRHENAEAIRNSFQKAREVFHQESLGVLDRLRELRDEWEELSEAHSGIRELHERLQSSYIELDDISSEVERMGDMEEGDPERGRRLKEKHDRLRDLMNKHDRDSIRELRELREQIRERIQGTGELDEREKELRERVEAQEAELRERAEALKKGRNAVTEKVSDRARSYLEVLGMASARLEVEVRDEEELGPLGDSSVALRFRSTPGAKPQELGKVASGGERSRVMLAMKAVFSEVRRMPSMILDEIDTGVSGDIAEKVGQIMKGMAERSQVIAITHLPQIAGKGDHHYRVFKEADGQETRTGIEALSEQERVEEVARMLSGEEMTQAAMEQARELLQV